MNIGPPALTAAGTAHDPLPTIEHPCPSCGSRLTAFLDPPTSEDLQLANVVLDNDELALYLAICEVRCRCEWRGSAYRPAAARAMPLEHPGDSRAPAV